MHKINFGVIMKIISFFDQATNTFTYIVHDESTLDAIIIDPVLNYDPASSKISFEGVNLLEQYTNEHKLKVHYIIETHAHADHLSSSQILKERFPESKSAIHENIKIVQETFKPIFNMSDLKIDGSQFDILIKDGDILKAGTLEMKAIHTPGHTPACTSFLIEDHLFTGDALFMPDFGTGRCDFPAGSATDLYETIHDKLYALPEKTKVYVGHDYGHNGREIKFQTTIGESKKHNIQLKAGTNREEFIKWRNERDATLGTPKLLLQSVQVNIDAGRLPKAEDNGTSYLKMPIIN